MLVLFETSAGYAIFKLLDEKKLHNIENLYKEFETPDGAGKVVKLQQFRKFADTTEALAAATALVEGKMSKSLKKMLKKLVVQDVQEELLVADAKLGNLIKEKFDIPCCADSKVQELMRCVRSQLDSLITGLPAKDLAAMSLGLAHSLSRYKLKFSPDKVDTMIVQAISLLDDLDKELNNYIMRAREWYGWHFPELGKLVTDHVVFAKLVKLIGEKTHYQSSDLSSLLPEELEAEVKAAAEISMGTEVSDEDILNIQYLCDQVIEITDYRAQLYDYIKNRMMAIAPNVTVLVGELVGARLIAHAGSLLNLAKHPSSTVQIIGAEKALFRALKTKHNTPKYGLIYHASLVGQSTQKNKGKLSRMLAAKTSLAIRVDALGEDVGNELGIEHRAKLEKRLRSLEEGGKRKSLGNGKKQAKWDKYENKSEVKTYNISADSTLPSVPKKRKVEVMEEDGSTPKAKKLKTETDDGNVNTSVVEESDFVEKTSEKKKHKKKVKEEAIETEETFAESFVEESSETPKKKKKKKKSVGDGES